MDHHRGNLPIIADRPRQPRPARFAGFSLGSARLLPALLAVAAGVAGAAVAVYYSRAGLALSHYDAKAHLVVARRIIDSITPGWVQIGAVWLPLPHLLGMIPVQVDVFYRTGAFAIAMSVVEFAATVFLMARIVLWASGSRVAAAAAVLAIALSPDVLYLQATPMTEPLLMALTMLAVWWGIKGLADGSSRHVRLAGLAMAAACLTRYEAWPVTAAIFGLGFVGLLLERVPWRIALSRIWRMAVYPAAAIAGFLILGRATVGSWFVQSGFFVPENLAMGRPARALVSVWWGVHELTSYPPLLLAAGGVLAVVAAVAMRAKRGLTLVPLALLAAGTLPWYAFYEGHPFRIRYMIPLIPAMGIALGLGIGLAGRARFVAGALAAAALALGPRPLDQRAPMVLEAQWDRPNRLGRAAVTAALVGSYDRQPIMASMGSLAHYMQELSLEGFAIRDFLHEGNGDIWQAALVSPYPHVGWILVEEQAEGGDMLAQLARQRPGFLHGFARVAEGGGVALYRRVRTSPESSPAY